MHNELTYSNEDIIIHLSISNGGRGSTSYSLNIYGDGSYKYKNTSSFKLNSYTDLDNKLDARIEKEDIKSILDFAKKINFKTICDNNPFKPQIKNSMQGMTISIWNESTKWKDEVTFLRYGSPEKIQEMRKKILEAIEENPYKNEF